MANVPHSPDISDKHFPGCPEQKSGLDRQNPIMCYTVLERKQDIQIHNYRKYMNMTTIFLLRRIEGNSVFQDSICGYRKQRDLLESITYLHELNFSKPLAWPCSLR